MSSATGTCSWPSTGPRACVCGALEPDYSVRSAQAFLLALARVAPFRIATLPTDHCQAFTGRFVTVGERTPTGQHAFDRLCQALGIGHRLTRPRHPQTHGRVERFNNRIADLLRTHCFCSRDDLRPTLHRYVTRYKHHPPQQALLAHTPARALQRCQASHPDLFHRKRPGRAM